MHRRLTRLIDAQARWADPLARLLVRALVALWARLGPAKDLLNGTWLGHPVHAAVTDVPVGALTVATVLDVAGETRAADLALATGIGGMLASAATGAADYVDTYGPTQRRATVHATLMAGSLGLALMSLAVRLARPSARPAAVGLSLLAYAGVTAGAYVGGDVAYVLGNMVDRHAWASFGKKWRPLDVDADAVPEGGLVLAHAGTAPLVLYRDGGSIWALHDVCAHAGGPLHEGKLVDGCVECPWHGSRFELADGHVRRGPSVYDQPVYEVRRTEAGGLEARPVPAEG